MNIARFRLSALVLGATLVLSPALIAAPAHAAASPITVLGEGHKTMGTPGRAVSPVIGVKAAKGYKVKSASFGTLPWARPCEKATSYEGRSFTRCYFGAKVTKKVVSYRVPLNVTLVNSAGKTVKVSRTVLVKVGPGSNI